MKASIPERSMHSDSTSSAPESEASTPGWRDRVLKHHLSSLDESSNEGSEDSSHLVKKAREDLWTNF